MRTAEPGPAGRDLRRIVLVGFMGSGKSTVGAALARAMGWRFLDMDRRIEERAGRSVAAIFRERGEAAFREEEARLAAEEVAGLDRYVVAAGGGAFTPPATREALRSGAVTVWLRCDLGTLLARIPEDGSRPMAANRAIMPSLLAEREEAYGLADLAVEASAGTPEEVARRVAEAISRWSTEATDTEVGRRG
jgi:shikimate kinase